MPCPVQLHRGLGAVLDGLEDHAVAVGELDQLVETALRRVGVETQAYLLEADQHAFGDVYRSASASLAPSMTKAPAKVRRIHVSTFGRDTTWLRIEAAKIP